MYFTKNLHHYIFNSYFQIILFWCNFISLFFSKSFLYTNFIILIDLGKLEMSLLHLCTFKTPTFKYANYL